MSIVRKLIQSTLLVTLLVAATAAAQERTILRAETAESLLKPGDLLVNYQPKNGPAHANFIVFSQKAIQKLGGLFKKSLREGDTDAVHVAVYVGNGRVAEAWGLTPSDAAVKVSSMNEHGSEIYNVYRHRDPDLASRAAAVARRWATAKMGFRYPLHVYFRDASFGSKARKEALRFGKDADRSGGPRGFGSMFCSQFAVGIYQAAVVAKQLAKNPRLSARRLSMPKGLRLHASNTSPLAMLGMFRAHSEFREVAKIQVDPTLPGQPSLLSRIGMEAKSLAKKLGLDKVGKAVRRGWSKVKSTLRSGAEKVRKGAKKVAAKLQEGVKNAAKKVGSSIKNAAKKVRSWFKF